jgi:hypothetical protein
MAKLSDTQLVVLSAACQRPNRSIYPLTVKLPGAATAKVLGSLLNKELVREVQAKREDTVWREDKKRGRLTLRVTAAAFKALGIDEAETSGEAEAAGDADGAEPAVEAAPAKGRRRKTADAKPKASGPRDGTKQAKLIDMLKRADGATIDEIVKKLDWQAHTVRGAIAGGLKKKLGLNVTSEKDEKRGRVYRVG